MKIPKAKKKISLIAPINEHLKKTANWEYSNGYKPEMRIKPSDLGHPCMRRIYYSTLRVPNDTKINAKGKRIFDTGDAFHDMVKGWVKGAGLLIEYVDPKTGKPPIDYFSKLPNSEFPIVVKELSIKKGKIDALIELDGELWIGEFKSMKEEKFGELQAPHEDHLMQANSYAHLFEFCWERGDYEHIPALKKYKEIAGVIFLYLCKDDTEMKEFIVRKSDESLDKVVARVAELKGYIERKELPPCTPHFCSYCPWKKTCDRKGNPLAEDESE